MPLDCSKSPRKQQKAIPSPISPSSPAFATITSKPPSQPFDRPASSQISQSRLSGKHMIS